MTWPDGEPYIMPGELSEMGSEEYRGVFGMGTSVSDGVRAGFASGLCLLNYQGLASADDLRAIRSVLRPAARRTFNRLFRQWQEATGWAADEEGQTDYIPGGVSDVVFALRDLADKLGLKREAFVAAVLRRAGFDGIFAGPFAQLVVFGAKAEEVQPHLL